MTIRISRDPFTDRAEDWDQGKLGPAWISIHFGGITVIDREVCLGIRSFVDAALAMEARPVTHGTVYAAWLDGSAVPEGKWHYDLGEYRKNAPTRYVGTWTSDGVDIQNEFTHATAWPTLVPPNDFVVAFGEGTDRHRRLAVPARPGAFGVFVSMALYEDHEPANLDCPRLAPLRDGSPRAIQAETHAPVVRTTY